MITCRDSFLLFEILIFTVFIIYKKLYKFKIFIKNFNYNNFFEFTKKIDNID